MKIVERINSLGRTVFDIQPCAVCDGASFISRQDAELFVKAKIETYNELLALIEKKSAETRESFKTWSPRRQNPTS